MSFGVWHRLKKAPLPPDSTFNSCLHGVFHAQAEAQLRCAPAQHRQPHCPTATAVSSRKHVFRNENQSCGKELGSSAASHHMLMNPYLLPAPHFEPVTHYTGHFHPLLPTRQVLQHQVREGSGRLLTAMPWHMCSATNVSNLCCNSGAGEVARPRQKHLGLSSACPLGWSFLVF